MERKLKLQHLIGIDVGIHPTQKNTGFADYSLVRNKFDLIHSMHYENLIQLICDNTYSPDRFCFMIENPDLDKTTFMTEKTIMSLYAKRRNYIDLTGARKVRLNIAQKAGENQALAKVIIKLLKAKDIPHIEVSPSARDRADKKVAGQKIVRKPKDFSLLRMPTKINSGQDFNDWTGYTGRTNEHSRDAATLVYQMTLNKVMMLLKMQHNNQSKRVQEMIR